MKIVRKSTYPVTEVDTADARLPQRNPPRRHIDTGASFTLTKGFTPVILTSGEVSLGTSSTSGSIFVPNHGLLQPVERTPMLIDELHFNIRQTAALNDPRWCVRTQLKLGRHAITNGFVPLAGLEYSYLTNTMYASKTSGSGDYANLGITGTRWKLPVPLYVPSGSVLNCELQISTFKNIGTGFADVTYVGRLLPVDYPVPRTIKIPYVTSIYADSAQSSIESKDLQLGNPFDTTFYAQRFIMRNFETNGQVYEKYVGQSPLITLRGTFANNDIQIANRVKHYLVFDDGFTASSVVAAGLSGHHAYNLYNLEMQPKDRFDLTIDWGGSPSNTPIAVAALIGWRNEEI